MLTTMAKATENKHFLGVRLSEDELKALDAAARELGESRSCAARMCLRKGLDVMWPEGRKKRRRA